MPQGDPGAFWGESEPDLLNMFDLLGQSAGAIEAVRPWLPLSAARGAGRRRRAVRPEDDLSPRGLDARRPPRARRSAAPSRATG